jgi:hypothetical protein
VSNMKIKPSIFIILLILIYQKVEAYEQKISISNSIDPHFLISEEEKYSKIIKDIFQDVLNNGLYFKIDKTEIQSKNGEIHYNIIGAKGFLKREVFERNQKKAKAFSYKKIFQKVYENSEYKYFIYTNNLYSRICINYELLDENESYIDGDKIRNPKESLTLDDFLENKNLKFNRHPEREKILNGNQDILIINTNFYHTLTYNEISRIKEINFKATECPNRN